MAAKRPTAFLSLATKRPTALLSLATPRRALHRLHAPTLRTPKPTPFVPDVPTFLTLIGRNLSAHAAKIPSWDALFALSSQQLRAAGVEPPRARRYLLWWRERYRAGLMGVGGDCKEVKDGVAELRVVEVPSHTASDREATLTRGAGRRKVVVNVAPTVSLPEDPAKPREEGVGSVEVDVRNAAPVAGIKIVRANAIGGTGVEPVKGHQGIARLRVKEGLWEERRGHKVDGGERRKAEVRYKRRVQEKKMAR